MDDNDFANMFKKAQEMINNNQIPDELKGLVNNMKSNNYSNGNIGRTNNNSSNNTMNKTDNYSNTSNNYYNKYSNTYSRNNNNAKNERNNTQNHNSYRTTENNNSSQSDFPDIDMETMLKLQNIMSKLKSNNSNDDMSKLLLSLKPYLRNEKKEKVDEYIKLIKMGKMTQLFDSYGGDKK